MLLTTVVLGYDSGPRKFVITGWRSTSAPFVWRLVLQDAHTRCKYSVQGRSVRSRGCLSQGCQRIGISPGRTRLISLRAGQVDMATRTLNAQCYKLNIGSPAQSLGRTTLRCQGTLNTALAPPLYLDATSPCLLVSLLVSLLGCLSPCLAECLLAWLLVSVCSRVVDRTGCVFKRI